MPVDLIREIAQQIVREEILLNWKLYAVLLMLGLIATVGGNWLSAYVRRRAETFATKADMQEVLDQIKATTKATEEVRSAVLHADWLAREWRTIRRTKLEELLSTVYDLDNWLDAQQRKWMFKESTSYDKSPIDKVNALVTLYFPELRGDVAAVLSAHHNANSAILETARKVNEAQGNLKIHKAAMDEFIDQWGLVYPPARKAISNLEVKAEKLMNEIAAA